MQRVLVTGGAGYIGSHTVVELIQAGHEVVVLDNLCNSSELSLRRVEQITGCRVKFIRGDVRDFELLHDIFASHPVDSVIHFAGLKSVSQSLSRPLDYYNTNVAGTITLCRAMALAGVFRMIFSSSATVYGQPETMPVQEEHPTGNPVNPYGRSKLMVEKVLEDMAGADERCSVALLRYFNPAGAHPSGLMGEDPADIPNNLVPYIAQVAVGRLARLSIFGSDYPTRDGTGVRDYIHVLDLAGGHLKALDAIQDSSGVFIWNLGIGRGHSVLEVLRAFEKACGRKIPYEITPRRDGDIAELWADPSRAEQDLGWKATRGLQEMMEDAWRWQSMNPQGFGAKVYGQ